MRITVINDEISDDIEEVILFLKENKIRNIDLRSINGRNIMDLSLEEAGDLYEKLKRNNISVSCLASPILKSFPSGKKFYCSCNKDRYKYEKYIQDSEDYKKAFDLARIFHCKCIRIFSFLKYDGFEKEDLYREIDKLLLLAKKYKKTILLENEPLCNINSIAELMDAAERFNCENFGILLDIGNLYSCRIKVKTEDLVAISKFVKFLHIKDYSCECNEYVPLGEGDINYKKHFTIIEKNSKNTLFYSIETHAVSDKKQNSKKAIDELKKIINRNRVRYGIVGCGHIHSKHVLAIKNDYNAELVGVYDILKQRSRKTSEENDCEMFEDLDDLIRSVDVVNICTPHNTHKDIMISVLQNDKKCLCEKPVCLNKKEADCIRKIKGYNKNIFCVFQNRFNDPFIFFNKLRKRNDLGKLIYISGNVRWFRDDSYYRDSPWHGKKELEGGILFNQGIHIIDIILKYTGYNKIKVINAIKTVNYHKDIETEDIFLVQCKIDGCLLNLEISTSVTPSNFESSLLFVFEKGSVEIGGTALDKVIYFNFPNKKNIRTDELEKHKDIYGLGHVKLIENLSYSLLNKCNNEDLVHFEEAFERVELINRFYSDSVEV